jgi:orotidine-5'-phosphate decarboxylase
MDREPRVIPPGVANVAPLDAVALALDTPDRAEFSRWCRLFGPRVGMLKVGLEAYCRWGRGAVDEAVLHARRVFLDLKLHDIPQTVAGAVAAVRDAGVSYLTVHAAGGSAMIAAARESAGDDLSLLAVTLLTHLEDGDLEALEMPGDRVARAVAWGALARAAGASGAVCSPLEVGAMRHALPEPFALVTPGIRWQSADPPPGAPPRDDQRRVGTPRQALGAGASYLVIGRPLTRAADPVRALDELERHLGQAPE